MSIEELNQFILLHPDNYSIQLKRTFPDLYNKIHAQYAFTKFSQKLYHFINGDEIGKCEYCGEQCKFDGLHKGYRTFCSYRCRSKKISENAHEIRKCVICNLEFKIRRKRKKTTCSSECLLKLNFNAETNGRRMNTLKNTMLEKYGVEHASKIVGFGDSVKKTKLKRHGNENYINVAKSKKTRLEKYGNENYVNIEKCRKTNLERYGVDNYSKTDEFKKIHFNKTISKFIDVEPLFDISSYTGIETKDYNFKCKTCNSVFQSYIDNAHIPICRICHPVDRELEQKNILNYIQSLIPTIPIKSSDRSIIGPQELDIYIPSMNLAIEYDGIYWHSELHGSKNKDYHLNKTINCLEKNVRLIHIFENEWLFKPEIVKQKLKHILNLSNNKPIYARKCSINIINSSDSNQFLDKYHIQGSDKSKIRLGAFFDGILVAMMTFGPRRNVLGAKNENTNEYEMYRFCSGDTNVVGIGGKLFSYFIKTYSPSKIITYANRRWSGESPFYSKIGMTLVGETPPSYWYFSNGCTTRLYHRYNFRKNILSKKLKNYDPNLTEWENMKLNGYDRIWDCGNYKYIWTNDL